MNKSRLETFSDGIFTIAITLLVITITQPDNYRKLTHQLLKQWPGLTTYVLSFVIIGIMWLNHHSIFGLLREVDKAGFYLNLLLLMTIAFLPYPTGVFGQALGRGQGMKPAAFFYSLVMAVNAIAWAALWLYASRGRRLLVADFPDEQLRPATIAFTAGTGLYAVAVLVALINAYACLAFHCVLAAYYALDPLSRNRRVTNSNGRNESDTD